MSLPPSLDQAAARIRRLLPARRKGASGVDYAVIVALVAIAVLGAVVLTGDRVRSLFDESNTTVGDGIAGLPVTPPGGGGSGGGTPPGEGQGAWSGDGAFALSPLSTPQSRTAVLTNVGSGVLALGGAPTVGGAGAASFQILSTDCAASLPAGDSCAVQIQASAGANGTAEATLSVAGVPGGLGLTRTATGFDPMISWVPGAPVAIDGSAATPASGQTTFTLRNDGFAPGAAAPIAVSGAGWSLVSTTCGATLQPSATCAVVLEAQAADNGPLAEATLTAAGLATTASGAASGFAPALAWTGDADFAIGAPPSTPATLQRTLTLSNTGTLGAPVAPAVSGDAGFALVSTTCGPTLAPSTSCAATVSFTAAANVADASGTLTSGGAPAATRALSGSAAGIAPALAWSGTAPEVDATPPATAPYGADATFVLTNTGNQDATGLGAVSVAGAGFSLVSTDCGPALPQGASCSASVRLEAAAAGAYPSTIAIAGGPSLAITGQAAGFAPALAWSGDASFVLDGSVATPASAQRTLTLANSGSAAASGLSVDVSGAGFSLVSTTCAASLAAGAACDAVVRAESASAGTFAGAIAAGGATLPLSATASGFAPAWAFDASPNGVFTIASPSATPATAIQTFVLRNTGTLAGAAPAVAVGGAHAADFARTGGTCAGQTLAPNATCTVQITFSASDNVAGRSATLAAAGASKALSGSASGFGPVLAWTGSAAFAIDGSSVTPATAQQTLTLANTGTLPASGLAVAVSGAGFTLTGTTCGSALDVNQTCTATVSAQAAANGSFAGSLTSGGGAPAALPLSATATGFAAAWAFDAAPAGTFSVASPATTASQTFTLRNVGTLAGTAPTRTIDGAHAADYALSGGTCTTQSLAPGETCTVSVTFTASANVAGRTAVLNAAGASKALSGSASGFNALLAWSGGGTIPTHSSNLASSAVTYTLTNSGGGTSQPIEGTLSIVSTPAGAFEISGGTCQSNSSGLATGQSCTVQVRMPNGGPAGTLTGTLATSVANAPTAAVSGTRNAAFLVIEQVSGGTLDASATAGNPVSATAANGGEIALLIRNTGNGNAVFTGGMLSASNATRSVSGVVSNPSYASGAAVPGANLACQPGSSNFTIAPGQACGLLLRYDVASNGTGSYTLNVLQANQPSTTFPVSVTGMGPRLAFTTAGPLAVPNSNSNFAATWAASTSDSSTITLRNTGNTSLGPVSLTFGGANPGDFGLGTSGNCNGTTLAPNATCTQTFRMTAVPASLETLGARTATVTASAGGVQTDAYPLTGTRTGAWFVIEETGPITLAYSPQGGTTATTTVRIRNLSPTNNTSSGTLTNAIAVTGTGYTVGTAVSQEGFACGTTIAQANHVCAFTITHTAPATPGTYNGTATLNAGLANGRTVSVALTATTTRGGAWEGTPSFDLATPGDTLAEQQVVQDVTLRNTGNVAIVSSGNLTRAVVAGTTTAGTFALGTAPSNACGTALAAGATCVQRVIFTATGPGTSTATLRASGTGLTNIDLPLTATVSNWGPRLEITGYTAHNSSSPNANPFNLDRTVTITNAGPTAIASGFARAISGANFTVASQTCGTSLAAGGTCTATLRFTATDNATGSGAFEASAPGVATATQALSASITGFVGPTWTTAAALTVGRSQTAYSQNLAATDPNNDLTATPAATRFQIVAGSLPPGLTFSSTGSNSFATVSGTIGNNAGGTYGFTVRATDSTGRSTDRSFTLDVQRWDIAGGITNTDGTFYYYTFNLTNRSATPQTFPGFASLTAAPGSQAFSFIGGASGCTGNIASGAGCQITVGTTFSPIQDCSGNTYVWFLRGVLNGPGGPTADSAQQSAYADPGFCGGGGGSSSSEGG